MTKVEVSNFRNDFQNAVNQLQKKYGVIINAGTIRYTQDELRFKVTAKKGKVTPKLTKGDFQVGDIVKINHKKVNSNQKFEVIKVMSKNIKLRELDSVQQFIVSPHLLVKA
jgi:hypothetical protein